MKKLLGIILALALLLLVVLPMAALILTILQLAVIVIGKKWLHEQEKKSSHPCPRCQGPTLDSALICPACGAEQGDVRRVGRFGLPTRLPLSERLIKKHCAELLTAKRCRWCATLLESGKAGTAHRVDRTLAMDAGCERFSRSIENNIGEFVAEGGISGVENRLRRRT